VECYSAWADPGASDVLSKRMTTVALLNVACCDGEVLAGAEFGPADQVLAGWNWREDASKDGSTVDDPLIHLAVNLLSILRLAEDFDLVSVQFGRRIEDQTAHVVADIEDDVLGMHPLGRMMMVSSHDPSSMWGDRAWQNDRYLSKRRSSARHRPVDKLAR
jgi:hypothetical protein